VPKAGTYKLVIWSKNKKLISGDAVLGKTVDLQLDGDAYETTVDSTKKTATK
jgi:hypothetical protein